MDERKGCEWPWMDVLSPQHEESSERDPLWGGDPRFRHRNEVDPDLDPVLRIPVPEHSA